MHILSNEVVFTAQFDSRVWGSMDDEQRSEWIDKATDALNSEALVTDVKVTKLPVCGALSVTVNGRRLVEHEEGCDVFQPGVLHDPATGDTFKNRREVPRA